MTLIMYIIYIKKLKMMNNHGTPYCHKIPTQLDHREAEEFHGYTKILYIAVSSLAPTQHTSRNDSHPLVHECHSEHNSKAQDHKQCLLFAVHFHSRR